LLGAVTGALLAAVIARSPPARTPAAGLPLALLTLSFALLADYVAFPPSWAGGPVTGLNVPRPQIGRSLATSSTRAFFLLALVMLVLASTVCC